MNRQTSVSSSAIVVSLFSGDPNPRLVSQTKLQPRIALDVGCGEGRDAIWLAEQSWDVTAVDISTVAQAGRLLMHDQTKNLYQQSKFRSRLYMRNIPSRPLFVKYKRKEILLHSPEHRHSKEAVGVQLQYSRRRHQLAMSCKVIPSYSIVWL